MRSYRINGWNCDFDQQAGEWYFSCPDCGYVEDDGHGKFCSRYKAENVKEDDMQEDDFTNK